MSRQFLSTADEWQAALVIAAFVATAVLIGLIIDGWRRQRQRRRRSGPPRRPRRRFPAPVRYRRAGWHPVPWEDAS